MKSAQSLPPHVVQEYRGANFSGWTLGGQWRAHDFDSLQKGASALWHNSGGTGIFPSQSVDPDYISGGTQDQDTALADPKPDLTPFTDPTGAGAHEDFWTAYFRLWYRPNHVVPSILSGDQQHEQLSLWIDTGTELLEIGAFDNFTTAESAEAQARELSRVGGDGGDPRIGADGKWWYEQIMVPKEAHQALILGISPELRLILDVNERDASDFGLGIERLTVEIVRGNVNDVAAARGGFGTIPAVAPTFPLELHRSILNSRRWI